VFSDGVSGRRLADRGAHVSARLGLEAPVRRIDATVDVKPAKFKLIASGGHWAAVWEGRGLAITVQGVGDPPDRLDLERCQPGP
jgi:hypothetical protein